MVNRGGRQTGVPNYSDDQKWLVRQMWPTASAEEIAVAVGRSVNSVCYVAKRMGLVRPDEASRPKWGRATPRECTRCGYTAPSYTFPVDGSGHRKNLCQLCVDAFHDEATREHRLRESKRRWRMRKAERDGRVYRSRADIQAAAMAKREAASRVLEERARDREVRRSIATSISVAEKYRSRYRTDPEFAQKERERTRRRKRAVPLWYANHLLGGTGERKYPVQLLEVKRLEKLISNFIASTTDGGTPS